MSCRGYDGLLHHLRKLLVTDGRQFRKVLGLRNILIHSFSHSTLAQNRGSSQSALFSFFFFKEGGLCALSKTCLRNSGILAIHLCTQAQREKCFVGRASAIHLKAYHHNSLKHTKEVKILFRHAWVYVTSSLKFETHKDGKYSMVNESTTAIWANWKEIWERGWVIVEMTFAFVLHRAESANYLHERTFSNSVW